MAEPSNVPSAWTIAQAAKQKYDDIYGATAPPLSDDIEEQAEHFCALEQLETMYLGSLIDHNTFSAPPNPGHYAVADMLLTKSITLALSTNVDALIENAGDRLFGSVVTATCRASAAALYPAKAPLVKIHGCWKADFTQTVWAPSQLQTDPNKTRIEQCAGWATVQLLNRDLIIIGYFTDWDYLNELFEECLGAVRPSNVIVVDPSPADQLQTKAPKLFELGERASAGFFHVAASGADFMAELRKSWSMTYFRRVLSAGNKILADEGSPKANAQHCEPPDATVKDLWLIRRDLEGAGPNDPCTRSVPHDDPVLGYAHVLLRAAGAQLEGSYWCLDGQRFRIIRSSGKVLNDIEKRFASSVSPIASADVTIAAGATDLHLNANIARSIDTSSVVRARPSRFMTLDSAIGEFGL